MNRLLPGTILVKLKKDDDRMKLKKGDLLIVKPYYYDPSSKYTVIKRVGDDFDPRCNVYRYEVEVVLVGK